MVPNRRGRRRCRHLFHYLGLAAREAAPRYRTPLPHLTPEYLAGLPVFARRYFEALALRLKPPCVLVFDNYQDVSTDAALHAVLCEGVATLPAGFTAMVLSRTDPPAEQARLRANETMTLIGWQELQLTPEEVKGIGKLKGQPPASLEQLYDKTYGWVAGLVLLLEQGKIDHLAAHSFQDRSPQVLFDYFAGEIFAKMEAEAQRVLLASAFLPKMTANMVAQLTHSSSAGPLLAELNRKNYFTLKLTHAEPVYEYHPLFREFLLIRAQQEWSQALLLETQQHAASILENAGQAEAAVTLYAAAGDWVNLPRLIIQQASQVIAEGRNQTLEKWLTLLPPQIVEETAWLLYWRGIGRLPFNTIRSVQLLRAGLCAFSGPKRYCRYFSVLGWYGRGHRDELWRIPLG